MMGWGIEITVTIQSCKYANKVMILQIDEQ